MKMIYYKKLRGKRKLVPFLLRKQVAYVQLGEIRMKEFLEIELCLNNRKGGIYGDY